MILLIIFIIELAILFFLSRQLTKTLYSTLHIFTRSQYASTAILTLLYLPGTVIHELAHLLTAEVLRVPTGEISFTPHIEEATRGVHEVKMGSVQIAHTDPLRRYLVGLAPISFGIFFLFLTIWMFNYLWPQLDQNIHKVLLTVLIGYILFAISNNMFSSKKDLEGFPIFLIVFIVISVALYLGGVRINVTGESLSFVLRVLTTLTKALGIVVLLNIVILFLNSLLLRIVSSLR